jgi:hypothetical protein
MLIAAKSIIEYNLARNVPGAGVGVAAAIAEARAIIAVIMLSAELFVTNSSSVFMLVFILFMYKYMCYGIHW